MSTATLALGTVVKRSPQVWQQVPTGHQTQKPGEPPTYTLRLAPRHSSVHIWKSPKSHKWKGTEGNPDRSGLPQVNLRISNWVVGRPQNNVRNNISYYKALLSCPCMFFFLPNDISGQDLFFFLKILILSNLIPNGASKTGVHSKYLKRSRKRYIESSK